MADKNVISTIEHSVERLLGEYRKLRKRCRDLVAERDTLKAANRALEERIKELEAAKAREDLAAGLAGGGRNKERARNRVNRLMREIDRCIALLGDTKIAAGNKDAE